MHTEKSKIIQVALTCFFAPLFIGVIIGGLIISQVFSFRNADGVPCEKSFLSLKVTCPPLKSENMLLPANNSDESNVTLILEKDKNTALNSPLEGLPVFLTGIRPDYVLSSSEVQQLLNNKTYQKYKDDSRLKSILQEAKKDSVLSIDEYQKIEKQLENIYYEDKKKADLEDAKQFVDQL